MDLESGFIVEPQLDGDGAGQELLHRSQRGYAEIWRVEKFGQFVVLKALKAEFRGDPVYEALIRKEFETGYRLNHPSICRTWHFRRHHVLGNCIEMEWIDGVSMDQRFSDGPPDRELFRKIASELCDAVSYLHSKQVIHRDLKPSNILITHNGDNVKLIDFGLADADDSALFKMPAGTEKYLAPEVRKGLPADGRTDIWALGTILGGLAKGNRKAIRKACAELPENRWRHVSDFKAALLKPSSGPYVVAAAAACVIAIGSVVSGVWKPKITPPGEEEADVAAMAVPDSLEKADTVAVPVQERLKAVPSGKKSSESAAATREDVDELFRKATDMFE